MKLNVKRLESNTVIDNAIWLQSFTITKIKCLQFLIEKLNNPLEKLNNS